MGTILIEWSVLLPRAMVMSRPDLQPRPMTGSVVLPQLGSVLMSVALFTTGGGIEELAPVSWTLETWACPLSAALAGEQPTPLLGELAPVAWV